PDGATDSHGTVARAVNAALALPTGSTRSTEDGAPDAVALRSRRAGKALTAGDACTVSSIGTRTSSPSVATTSSDDCVPAASPAASTDSVTRAPWRPLETDGTSHGGIESKLQSPSPSP